MPRKYQYHGFYMQKQRTAEIDAQNQIWY